MQVANLSTIWTVSYTQPSRYNWMLQYYLRAEGLALSWVGTGRLIFSLNYTRRRLRTRSPTASSPRPARCEQDGFWWSDAALTNKAIKRRILREMLTAPVEPLAALRRAARALGGLDQLAAQQVRAAPCGTA